MGSADDTVQYASVPDLPQGRPPGDFRFRGFRRLSPAAASTPGTAEPVQRVQAEMRMPNRSARPAASCKSDSASSRSPMCAAMQPPGDLGTACAGDCCARHRLLRRGCVVARTTCSNGAVEMVGALIGRRRRGRAHRSRPRTSSRRWPDKLETGPTQRLAPAYRPFPPSDRDHSPRLTSVPRTRRGSSPGRILLAFSTRTPPMSQRWSLPLRLRLNDLAHHCKRRRRLARHPEYRSRGKPTACTCCLCPGSGSRCRSPYHFGPFRLGIAGPGKLSTPA
jgi:hypothetical protein